MKSTEGLYYTDQGAGEPVIFFLHYFGGSAQTWEEVIRSLSPKHRCIAIDLYGFGDSDAPTGAITILDQVTRVEQLIASIDPKTYILVGHSMGGKIALSLAARNPKGLHGVILVAPSPPSPEPMTDAQRIAMLDTFANLPDIEELILHITATTLDSEVFYAVVADHLKIDRTAWNSWIETGSQEDISGTMGFVTVPVFMISASQDRNFSTDFLRKTFTKYLALAGSVEIQQSGHLLPLEQPRELALTIQRFIDQFP